MQCIFITSARPENAVSCMRLTMLHEMIHAAICWLSGGCPVVAIFSMKSSPSSRKDFGRMFWIADGHTFRSVIGYIVNLVFELVLTILDPLSTRKKRDVIEYYITKNKSLDFFENEDSFKDSLDRWLAHVQEYLGVDKMLAKASL